jgi:HK97 family phage portal protein
MFEFLKRADKKSSNNNTESPSVGLGCNYIDANADNNPRNLLLQNTSFVWACNKKVEQYISSVPIHAYFRTDCPDELLTDNAKVSKRVLKSMCSDSRLTVKSCLEDLLEGKAEQIVEITDTCSPLNEFIRHPAPGYSWADWIGVISTYLSLTGNALMEIHEEGGQLISLTPLKWEHTFPFISSQDGSITYYTYAPPNEVQRKIMPEQVIHLKCMSAGSLTIGKGNLEACLQSAALYSYFDSSQLALAKNYGMPGVMINVKNKIGNKDDAKAIANDFVRKFTKGNTGKPIIGFGDIDVVPLNITPRQMEFTEGRDWCKKVICACMGVPEDMVDTSDSNRASSANAIQSFITVTIYPMLNKILEQLNTQVVERFFDENSFLYYDAQEILEKDQASQTDVVTKLLAANIISVDEARNILGMDAVAPDDLEEAVEPTVEAVEPEEILNEE